MTEQKNPEIIKKIDDFMKWVHSTKTPMLYRGMPLVGKYDVSSSMFLRMFSSRKPRSHANTHFKQEVIELVEKARRLGHGFKGGKKLSDLELLAELQHYGAATCLVDFTHNALIALWFACQPNKGDNNRTKLSGKVVRFDSESEKCIKIGSKHLDKTIDYFLEFGTSLISEGNSYQRQTQDMVFVWHPLHQNERITAQQSVFLFGPPKIPIDESNDFIIPGEYKKDITEELRKIGVFEDALFCDFHGFAKINAHDRKHPDLSAEYHCNKGQENYNVENYKMAIQYYTSALLSNKKCGKAYYGIAQAKYKMGDFASAILDYRKAIVNGHNKDADVYYYLGISERNYGDTSQAIICFGEAIKSNQNFEEAYLARGDSYRILGKYNLAIKDYKKVIEMNQNAFSAFYNLGNINAALDKHQDAINDYKKAISINPQYADAFYNRGISKGKQGKHQGAILDFDKVISINPQYANVFFARGVAKAKSGQHQDALRDFDEDVHINPQNATAFFIRGITKGNLGHLKDAIDDYSQAININPQFVEVIYNRGVTKGQLDQHQNAIRDFDEVICLAPKFANAFYNRGNAKGNLGEYPNAIKDYDEAIDINRKNGIKDAKVFLNRAICKSHLGDKQGAWTDIQEAKQLDPKLEIPKQIKNPNKDNKK